MYTTILTLYKQRISQRQIARLTGSDRKTVKRIIKRYEEEEIELPLVYKRGSKLSTWHEDIVRLLESNLSYVRILEELKLRGCGASYSALTRYIDKHNINQDTCIRFHTLPGEEAQVDFGDIGLRICPEGRLRKAYVFNMRLSYSRLDYYEVVFNQKVSTWVKCHINAFNYFTGVPRVVKLDNLKAGILKAEFYEPIFQKDYKRLSDHYNFLLSPCRVYQPQEKGKVESGIKYVKNNFFAGREFSNYADMSKQLVEWLERVNYRIHGTTKVRPRELFNTKEAMLLGKLPVQEFDMSLWGRRKVAKDCHISLDNSYYSVPAKYVGNEVEILSNSELVKIYAEGKVIATHIRAKTMGIFTTNSSHYAEGKRYCPGFVEYDEKYQNLMKQIGNNCSVMLSYLQQEHKADWYRTVRGIIKLRNIYSDEAIDKACKRALSYGISSYNKIKTILENNSYDLPLPEERGNYANIA